LELDKLDKIIYEKDGNIARITLNYPEKLNAFDFPGQGGIMDQLYFVLDKASEDDDIKVVVIKAAGRAFCVGHDLTKVGFIYGFGEGKPGERRPSQRTRLNIDRHWFIDHHLARLFLHPKITIAQIHGYCIGEGVMITCFADLAVTSEDAQFGSTEQRLGFAGSGVPYINALILTVGFKRALDLLLTGRMISGKEAEEIGLVNKAVTSDKLEEEVNALAKSMTLLPRDGIAIGKATRHIVYNKLKLLSGFIPGYYSHTFFTNLRWEPDEYNFFKERRDKGAKAGFHERDKRYAGLV